MAHRRGSFRGRAATPRRKKTWVQALLPAGVGVLEQPWIQVPDITPTAEGFFRVVDLFPPGAANENKIPTESTVLRIRGQVTVPKSAAAALFTAQAWGVCVLDLPTDPLTSDDIPGPLSAPEWDGWMFIRGPSDQVAVDVQGTMYDVKAMRKVEGGKRLAFVSELYADAVSGTPQQMPTYSARVLLALP